MSERCSCRTGPGPCADPDVVGRRAGGSDRRRDRRGAAGHGTIAATEVERCGPAGSPRPQDLGRYRDFGANAPMATSAGRRSETSKGSGVTVRQGSGVAVRPLDDRQEETAAGSSGDARTISWRPLISPPRTGRRRIPRCPPPGVVHRVFGEHSVVEMTGQPGGGCGDRLRVRGVGGRGDTGEGPG